MVLTQDWQHHSFAGHDALAISMRAILYHLCKKPEAYKELIREIRQADTAGKLSPIASYAQAASLPYLYVIEIGTSQWLAFSNSSPGVAQQSLMRLFVFILL